MNLADNLKRIRKDNNLSQEQLAEKLGVSRQAVSKWESGLSYPEMDKVLQICQLFNLNIDELINEDIKEVTEIKEAQSRSNKYVTSFFDYITKVVDMFSSMNWKEKIKCLFEQCVIGFIICVVLVLIGVVGASLLSSILNILPYALYFPLYHFFESLYLVIAFIVGVVILLHIFKIRYLDYYEIVKEEVEVPAVEEVVTEVEAKGIEDEENKKNKIILEKKKEKVIIRDPNHSEYKFFTGVGKVMLWFIKFMASFVLMMFIATLISLVVCVPISFLVIKSGLLFWGLIVGLIGAILVNIVILKIIYDFIVNKKWNKMRVFVVSVLSFIMIGMGIGMACVSLTQFDVIKVDYETDKKNYTFEMQDDLKIFGLLNSNRDVVYIEKDTDKIEVEVEYPKYLETIVYVSGDFIYVDQYDDSSEMMNVLRGAIEELNNKKIVDYVDKTKLYIYGSKDNLDIIKNNVNEYDAMISGYQQQVEQYGDIVESLRRRNEILEEKIIDEGYQIIYDDEAGGITLVSPEDDYYGEIE